MNDCFSLDEPALFGYLATRKDHVQIHVSTVVDAGVLVMALRNLGFDAAFAVTDKKQPHAFPVRWATIPWEMPK